MATSTPFWKSTAMTRDCLLQHFDMGTVIQDAHDIDRLMKLTEHLGLLFDTGYLYIAGVDPLSTLQKHGYKGCIIVEAEQDPKKAEPFTYSKLGYETVTHLLIN